MISKKGFLFTISIILFSTTLVFYSQIYSDSIVRREFFIIDNFKSQIVPFVIDNISADIIEITGIKVNTKFEDTQTIINLKGSLPKKDLQKVFSDYKYFLDNNYFSSTIGQKDINLLRVFNEGFVVDFPNNKFVFDYKNSNIFLKESFNSLDLNLFLDSSDLNYYESNFSNFSEGVPINIRYFDDANIITISENLNLNETSFINFVYNDDSNILLRIGDGADNYFLLDSNKSNKLNYSLVFTNDFFDEFFYSKTNINFEYELDDIFSSSLIQIR